MENGEPSSENGEDIDASATTSSSNDSPNSLACEAVNTNCLPIQTSEPECKLFLFLQKNASISKRSHVPLIISVAQIKLGKKFTAIG